MMKTNRPLGYLLGVLPALFLIVDVTMGGVLPAFYQQNAVIIRPLLAVAMLMVYVGLAFREGALPLWALPGIGVCVLGVVLGGFDMFARATYDPLDPQLASGISSFGPALYAVLAVALIAWGGRLAARRFGPWAVLLPLSLLILLPMAVIQPVPVVLLALTGSQASVVAAEILLLLPALVIVPILAMNTAQAGRLRWLIIGAAALTFEAAALVEPIQLAILQNMGDIGPHTMQAGVGGGIFGYNQLVAVVNVVVVAGVVLLYEWLAETAPTRGEAAAPHPEGQEAPTR